ncbi:unnamed protein product, partial [Amoebophrya sp. A120]
DANLVPPRTDGAGAAPIITGTRTPTAQGESGPQLTTVTGSTAYPNFVEPPAILGQEKSREPSDTLVYGTLHHLQNYRKKEKKPPAGASTRMLRPSPVALGTTAEDAEQIGLPLYQTIVEPDRYWTTKPQQGSPDAVVLPHSTSSAANVKVATSTQKRNPLPPAIPVFAVLPSSVVQWRARALFVAAWHECSREEVVSAQLHVVDTVAHPQAGTTTGTAAGDHDKRKTMADKPAKTGTAVQRAARALLNSNMQRWQRAVNDCCFPIFPAIGCFRNVRFFDSSTMVLAVKRNHVRVVELIVREWLRTWAQVSRNINRNACSSDERTTQSGRKKKGAAAKLLQVQERFALQLLVQNSHAGHSPLSLAIECGAEDVVKFFLRAGSWSQEAA